MQKIIPEKLKKGDKIMIIAPSTGLKIIGQDCREIACERFEKLGLTVEFAPHTTDENWNKMHTGSLQDRVSDIMYAFQDKSVNAIFTIIGGLASVIGFAIAGLIADKIGRKWTVASGLGLSFLGLLVMCLVPFTVPWQRFLCSIALLPITVGCSFEAIQFAGRSDSTFAKIFSWPGLQLQRITTREPDASQIEIAIAALTPCIPENMEDDKW